MCNTGYLGNKATYKHVWCVQISLRNAQKKNAGHAWAHSAEHMLRNPWEQHDNTETYNELHLNCR